MKCLKILMASCIIIIFALASLRYILGPLLYQNITKSAPRGLYVYNLNQHLRQGDYAIVSLPKDVHVLNKKQGFLLLKKAVAFEGTKYSIKQESLQLNTTIYPICDQEGLPHQAIGNYTVPIDHILFLNDAVDSFDSRYLGPISRQNVVCKVNLLIDYDELATKWKELTQ